MGSHLRGALIPTTRGSFPNPRVAKRMLRSGRKPLDKPERMIFNNYHAISFIKKVASEESAPDLLLGMHTLVHHYLGRDRLRGG